MTSNYITQIKATLSATGWSQVKLAREIGVTFAALNRWLNQRAEPRPSTQKEIYRVYKEQVGILPLSDKSIREALHFLDREKKKHKNIKKIIKENKHLREDLLLELTYNSNAIEGSTLTKKQTETIIFDKAHIPDKSYIEHLEATNHAVVLDMIFDGKFEGPITEKTIKKLHGIILQGINPDAGKYSKHHRAIRGVNLSLPHPEDIPEEMSRLLRKFNHFKDHIVKHTSKTHASFEAIHPFGDGNGRVGRLLMIIQLLNAGYAPCLIENRRKSEYYETLEYAQKKSETHLIKFIIECIQKGYLLVRKHKK